MFKPLITAVYGTLDERHLFLPGDMAVVKAGYEARLVEPHPYDALEHEAFTGWSNCRTVGALTRSNVGLVMATREGYVCLLTASHTYGWTHVDGLEKV